MAAGTAVCCVIAGMNLFGKNSVTNDSFPEKKAYTIMVYMVGSNLELVDETVTKNIEDMQGQIDGKDVISEDTTNVVIETGGSYLFAMPQIPSEYNSRFLVQPDQLIPLCEQEKEVRNMGESQTLTEFVDFCMETYPANKYILICSDHGMGAIEGFGRDVNFNGDSLTLKELDASLKTLKEANQKLDAIAFDACLMGGIETADICADYADYMVASEMTEPSGGFSYSWLSLLEDPTRSTEYICRQICKSYLERYDTSRYKVGLSTYNQIGRASCRERV